MNPFSLKLPVDYTACAPAMRRAVREEYIRIQEGKCSHCKQPLAGSPPTHITNSFYDARMFPPGMLTHPIHLHHDHTTGMTIGAVHARCNAYLWQYLGQ